MFNWQRVWAIVIRHFYGWRHDLDRLTDAFYWPAIDIFMWGFAATFFSRFSSGNTHVLAAILTGAIFWMIIWRGQYEITVNLLEEMWAQNLGSLFSSPLTVIEWVTAVFLLGILKMILIVGFASLLAFYLYSTNVFTLGFIFMPFTVSLLLTGWSLGLIVAGLIIYFGTRIQAFAWTGAGLIMPFIGIYYPVSTLPAWGQTISSAIPVSYIFEGMRQILFTGTFSIQTLWMSYLLNGVYLIGSLLFFFGMFDKSRKQGLTRWQ